MLTNKMDRLITLTLFLAWLPSTFSRCSPDIIASSNHASNDDDKFELKDPTTNAHLIGNIQKHCKYLLPNYYKTTTGRDYSILQIIQSARFKQ